MILAMEIYSARELLAGSYKGTLPKICKTVEDAARRTTMHRMAQFFFASMMLSVNRMLVLSFLIIGSSSSGQGVVAEGLQLLRPGGRIS